MTISIYYYLVIISLIIILIIYIKIFNKFRSSKIKILEADSGIEVALLKRYDVLVKMIDVVKSYTKHEKETLFKIVKLRQKMTINDKQQLNNDLDDNYDKLNLLVEQYPDLKANDNYKALQESIIDVEEHLQAARRLYNANVTVFNQLVHLFPTNIVGIIMNLKSIPYFKTSENKKTDIQIQI